MIMCLLPKYSFYKGAYTLHQFLNLHQLNPCNNGTQRIDIAMSWQNDDQKVTNILQVFPDPSLRRLYSCYLANGDVLTLREDTEILTPAGFASIAAGTLQQCRELCSVTDEGLQSMPIQALNKRQDAIEGIKIRTQAKNVIICPTSSSFACVIKTL